MTKRFIDIDLQCDICVLEFDLSNHRPKSLPCGHTICEACVSNPALERKCPLCRKALTASEGSLPDNIFITRLLEKGDAQPIKVPRREDTSVLQLLRGVDAGRKLVQQLRQLVPVAVEALNSQLAAAVAQLRQVEEALEHQLRQKAAGDVCTAAAPAPAPDPALAVRQRQLVLQLEDSLRLLAADKCSVVAEEGAATWRASVQLAPADPVWRLLLLQLRADGLLQKVDVVGPPRFSTLAIDNDDDLDDRGRLMVEEILSNGRRWKNIRTLVNVNGHDSEGLLRVVGADLEELEVAGQAGVEVLEEVRKMQSLKRLIIKCEDSLEDCPALPPQLEELAITQPSEQQLRCIHAMPRLRSLMVDFYCGPTLAFPPAPHGSLLWLGVSFHVLFKDTMLSLIASYSRSLQELQVYTPVGAEDEKNCYFPDLGERLAACGLQALRRVVLERPTLYVPCPVDACLLQRQTIRGSLAADVDVLCDSCNKSVF